VLCCTSAYAVDLPGSFRVVVSVAPGPGLDNMEAEKLNTRTRRLPIARGSPLSVTFTKQPNSHSRPNRPGLAGAAHCFFATICTSHSLSRCNRHGDAFVLTGGLFRITARTSGSRTNNMVGNKAGQGNLVIRVLGGYLPGSFESLSTAIGHIKEQPLSHPLVSASSTEQIPKLSSTTHKPVIHRF
jgi:hypothetical protein